MSRPLSYYLLRPLQQWKAGLLDCLPAGLRSRLIPVIEPYVLDLGDYRARLYRRYDGTEKQLGMLDIHESHVDAGLLSLLNSRKAPLLMLLPSAWVLSKKITLPAAAQENLGQVIQFEMDRLTPFAADQVYYDYRFEAQSAADELLPVNIALVPKKKIESWLSLLDGSNIILDRISSEGLWQEANFLPREARPQTSLKQAALKTLPAMLVIALLLVAMALPLWQKRGVAIAMKTREAPLKQQANGVVGIRDRLQAELERQQKLHAAWTQYPPAVDVVKVLTDLLPDDTSLQQMDIKGALLIIRGTSSQASSLIKLLEESTGFSDVKFMSSVVQQRGKEQFHLSANIDMPFLRANGVTAAVSVAPQTSAESVTPPSETPVAAGSVPAAAASMPPSAGNQITSVVPAQIESGQVDSGAPATQVFQQTAKPVETVHSTRPVDTRTRSARLISGAGG